MPGRLIKNDLELNEAFELKEPAAGDHADSCTIIVTCKLCPQDDSKPPRSWEVDLDENGAIDKGSRIALLQHARAHSVKPRLRRRA